MNDPINMFTSNLFVNFLETYFKQNSERNKEKHKINIETSKRSYNIYVKSKEDIIKYYYFIYTEYMDNNSIIEERSYKNKRILFNLIKRLNQSKELKNIEYEIITLLEESEIDRLYKSKSLGKINSNIKILGKKIVNDIIKKNRILFINILSTKNKIEDLFQQIKLVTVEDRESYDKRNIELLIEKTKKDEFSLVLGAGVSFDSGALMWNELLDLYSTKLINSNYISNKKLVYKQVGESNLIIAQLAKGILSYSDDNTYYNILMKGLYPGLYPDNNIREDSNITDIKTCFNENSGAIEIVKDKEDYILYHVARVIHENKTKNNFRVLTYNYDNYLELFIDNIIEEEYRFDYNSLYKFDTKATKSTSIYHVHGFLPYKRDVEDIEKSHMKSVVLTEQDYNNLYNNPYSWEIATQLFTYRENACLFIGSSLTDPNIRRILRITKNKDENNYSMHYALMHKPENISTIDYAIIEKHFYEIGIIIIWTNDYGIEVVSQMY